MDVSHHPPPSGSTIGSPTPPSRLLARVPSFTWSECSYDDHLEITDLPDLIGIDLEVDPETWVTTIKEYVKSTVYSFVGLNKLVMLAYQESNATQYKCYKVIEENTAALWESWEEFAARKDITEAAILESPLYYNFSKHISLMQSPRLSNWGVGFRGFRNEGLETVAAMRYARDVVEAHLGTLNGSQNTKDKSDVSPGALFGSYPGK